MRRSGVRVPAPAPEGPLQERGFAPFLRLACALCAYGGHCGGHPRILSYRAPLRKDRRYPFRWAGNTEAQVGQLSQEIRGEPKPSAGAPGEEDLTRRPRAGDLPAGLRSSPAMRCSACLERPKPRARCGLWHRGQGHGGQGGGHGVPTTPAGHPSPRVLSI